RCCPMDPVNLTYFAAIALGCVLLSAVIFVFVRDKKIAIGGVTLALVGLALIGLPITKALHLSWEKGIDLETNTLARRPDSPAPNLSPSLVQSVRYKVAIVNQSDSLKDSDVEPVVSALQKQVDRDLSPAWGVSADLTFVPKGAVAPTDAWTLALTDK